MKHNGAEFTEEEYSQFCELVRGAESPNQLRRINARLDQPAFIQKHGRIKCDAMFDLMRKTEGK